MRSFNGPKAACLMSLVIAVAGCGGGGGTSLNQPPPMAPPNTAPALSSVPDQSIDEDGFAGPFTVTAADAESDPGDLELTAASSDEVLLPAAGIRLAGSGAERELVLVPAAGQSGAADVTLTVTDGEGASTSRRFRLEVNALVRVEFPAWIRDTVLARGELDAPVGEIDDDRSPLGEMEDILRMRFSDGSAEDPAAYDDLLPEP